MKKLILTILLAAGIQGHAGNDGGGGGGFCFKETRCVTLAEAGFRLQNESNKVEAPILPFVPEVLSEAIHIINSLPVRQQYKSYLIEKLGNLRMYSRTTSYNKSTINKIKKDYQDLLEKNGQSARGLVIYALSNSEHTYLLPEFYKLNIKSQALILIHESWVRKSGSFIEALRLDGFILDLLEGKDVEFDFVEIINYFWSKEIFYYNTFEYCIDCNTGLVFTYADIYLKNNKLYLPLSQIVPVHLKEVNKEKYCLTLEEEISFYKKHKLLYEKMKKYNMAMCFTFNLKKNFNPTTEDKYEQELGKVCSADMSGYYIVPINNRDFRKGSASSKNWYGFPGAPPIIECKDGRTISVTYLTLEHRK